MLTAKLLGPEGEILGAMSNDFIFQPFESCIVHSIGFYRGKKQLFRTDLDIPRSATSHDEIRVNLDSGIGFYYIATKIQEPFVSAKVTLSLWRSLREMVRKIIHERKARNELDTWNKQVYEVLFHEKQQSVSRRNC